MAVIVICFLEYLRLRLIYTRRVLWHTRMQITICWYIASVFTYQSFVTCVLYCKELYNGFVDSLSSFTTLQHSGNRGIAKSANSCQNCQRFNARRAYFQLIIKSASRTRTKLHTHSHPFWHSLRTTPTHIPLCRLFKLKLTLCQGEDGKQM